MKKSQKPPESILEAFEKIVDAAESSKLSEEFFFKNRVAIRYITSRLEFTPMQAVLMSLLIDQSDERNISVSKLAKYLGCRNTHILRLTSELEGLEKSHYIRIINGHNSMSYRVPKEVIKALSHDEPFVYEQIRVNDSASFFDYFRRLVNDKGRDELSYAGLREKTIEFLNEIPSSSLCREIKRYKLSDDDKTLFIYLAHLFVDDNNEDVQFYEIERLYDDDEIPVWVRRELRDRSSQLFECGLIENSFEDGMARSDAFKLTEKAKYELLADLDIKAKGKSIKGLIRFESLPKKKMFYNAAEALQIKELEDVLSIRKFAKVQKRLRDAGMRSGFSCLFYGAPGTGKTETVYQLARATRRPILQVDADKIKSCWVGESEKNIKAVFERYRNICRNSRNIPILLFNEADAVLGVRMEGVERAVDKMENSIQNIILQEMEKLEGIMIATTNLTANLDKAFERRFLYKIKFTRPDKESRSKIWKSLVPGLKKSDATRLGARFDLSGGQIENIARRHTVNSVLSGLDRIDLDYLLQLSHAELRSFTSAMHIGY